MTKNGDAWILLGFSRGGCFMVAERQDGGAPFHVEHLSERNTMYARGRLRRLFVRILKSLWRVHSGPRRL